MLNVIEVPGTDRIGRASRIDLAELEALRDDLRKQMDSQARTLDQLSTAVAIFDRSQAAQSSTTPPTGRSGRSTRPSSTAARSTARSSTGCAPSAACPNRPITAAWKAGVMAAYQAVETSESRLVPAGRPHAARRHQPQPARAASSTSSTT